MAKQGVLLVHGMGEGTPPGEPEFGEKLEKRLRKELDAEVTRCWYAREMDLCQGEFWDAMRDPARDGDPKLDNGPLRRNLRKFSLGYLGDAVAYVESYRDPGGAYSRAHAELREQIAVLRGLVEGGPVSIVAHSLGAKVVSDYFWDAHHGSRLWTGAQAAGAAEGECVHRIFSLGCNIPLFVSSTSNPQAIDPALMAPGFRWLNYYDRDDLLGWPLAPLSESYREVVDDAVVRVAVRGRPIAAHIHYWEDRSVADRIIDELRTLQ